MHQLLTSVSGSAMPPKVGHTLKSFSAVIAHLDLIFDTAPPMLAWAMSLKLKPVGFG